MPKRNLKVVDEQGNEPEEGFAVWVPSKHAHPYERSWFMKNQRGSRIVATDRDYTLVHYRVREFLLSELDFGNWIFVAQTEIAEALELDKAQVSKAITFLVKKGFIERSPKPIGRSHALRLKPAHGYKGDAKDVRTERDGSLTIVDFQSRQRTIPDMTQSSDNQD